MKEIFQNYLILYSVKVKNENKENVFVCTTINSNSFGNAELEFFKKYGNAEQIIEIYQIVICN